MTAELRRLGTLIAIALATSCGGIRGPAPDGERRGPAAAGPPTVSVTPSMEGAAWVERTLSGFSLEQLAGQLVIEWIPGGYTAPTSPEFEPLRTWVEGHGIGGVSPSIGTPHAYVAKLNALQEHAEVPLLVASDFENGGPGMRLSGTYALPSLLPQGGGTAFPPTMAFGAIDDERFAFEYGRMTALEARATGVHMLFAPVLDVNSNPDNPVISTRSFGADPEAVARLGTAFVRGAREGGALTTAKHFPGHGDTSVDSHLGLPVVDANRERLDSLELVPFVRAIEEGVDGVMTAHVQLPELLGPGSPPATLSAPLLTGLLRDELGFDGLVLTDALTMRAITDMYGIREASIRALEAGADVILAPRAVPEVVAAVVDAVRQGRLERSRLEASARRILEMKARLGLHRGAEVSLDRVDEVVGSGAHLAFADSAAARSITLVRDPLRLVPLDANVRHGGGRSVSRPDRTPPPFVHVRYAPSSWLWAGGAFSPGLRRRVPRAEQVVLDERSDSAAYARAAEAVEAAADEGTVLITAYVPPSAGSGPGALPEPFRELVDGHAPRGRTILVSLGNPYLLSALPHVGSYLVAWGDREVSQRAALGALFGEEAVTGRLPVPLPPAYPIGHGLDRPKTSAPPSSRSADDPLVAAGIAGDAGDPGGGAEQREASPSAVGMEPDLSARLDAIVETALADSAASGAALAVGRHGRLVHLRGYGELAWGSGRPVTPTSLFDLASVSKVVGTTTAVMQLVQEDRLDLDAPVVSYLPEWARGDPRKRDVTVRDLLVHRAGLPPFRRWFFELEGEAAYRAAVADEPLEAEPGEETVYSDMGPMTLAWIVEAVTGEKLDAFLERRVWEPLGMRETLYRPDLSLLPRIAATELDTTWRNELVWGRVHDENADAMGGVAGHAGLFSTALDLSVFARMMSSGGRVPACAPGEVVGEPCPVPRPDSVRLLEPEVLREFTARQDPSSSRALGWDTPEGRSSAGDYFTESAFGHTGYTGTSLWIDPELDVWVVLLTNRVHPTRENRKHIPLRRAVHDAVARAITDLEVTPRGN
ncbi:MAG: glycoside hydrolase family 3 N-terminal domain-containing protein [Gemmatimonadota bacterium]|nr:glycoside hydrolase family 3 N-terminal domain-containing protein [Gemmatimonadota bacterium]